MNNYILDSVANIEPSLNEPIIGLGIYFFINILLKFLSIDLRKNRAFKHIVLTHNLILTAYSGWTFYNAYHLLTEMGLDPIMNKNGLTVLSNKHFYGLTYLFYMSKYYEFFDTWIHLLKNRNPSFLQVYHHIGAVIDMYLLTKYKVDCAFIFVLFNSFVHTVMYTYYAISIFGIRLPVKPLITVLQLVQFIVGISLSYYYFTETNMNNYQFNILIFTDIYLMGLVYLFVNFFKKTYQRKKTKIKNIDTVPIDIKKIV